MGKIFISHSSANNAEALAIGDWLAEHGWGDVFLDLDPRRGLVAGDRWQAALKAAAEQCELILILISPAWAKSKWCLAEFLLAKQMNKQILGVVVEATPYADLPVELTAEWQLVDLSATDPGWSTTISPPRFEPETTVRFSGTGLARLAAGLQKAGLDATTFLWPPDSDPGRAPYRGLLPLDADDAGIFFGRDGAIVLTLDALRGLRAGAAPRFATILGASGAGKSSFLRAGLLPRLSRDSRHFYVLPVVRPGRAVLTGEHGFAAMLETALKARNLTRNRADIRDAVGQGASAVAPLLRQLVATADAGDAVSDGPPTLVIAIDQAEELLGADNAEASAFLTLLADLGRADDPAVLVLFTVRSDSFEPLQSRPELAATQPHHLVDLPPIPAGSFGDIIRSPARRVTAAGRKLVVDETLVDALLADIEQGGTKDALPLLAFTLERLYRDYGADGGLQLAEYEKLGRIRGAIEAAVEQALGRADTNSAIPRDRAARLALLRRGLIPWLAGIDPETGIPRRRVARLAEVPEEARPLIELMVEQRLLATDVDKATGERTIEPAHEALLRQWGALDGWLVEDSADLAILEALRRAATDWDANARGAEFVVHGGARLETAEQVAAADKFAAYLTSVDRAYLAAARATQNTALAKVRATRRRTAIAASVAGIVLVAGLTAGWFVWSAGQAAKTEAAANFDLARASAALGDGKPEEAARAALAAYAVLPNTVTRTAAFTAALAISPNAAAIYPIAERTVDTSFIDPDHVMVLGAKGTLTTLDLGMRKTASVATLPPGPLPIALSPDGSAVIYADASITDRDGKPIAAVPADGFAARAGTASSSDDGKLLGLLGLTGDAFIRDCRSLPCVDRHFDAATAIAIKPGGTGFALSNGTSFDVYDDPAGPPRSLVDSLLVSNVMGLAWAPDGTSIAVVGPSFVSVVDTTTPAKPGTAVPRGMARLTQIAWSPDGTQFAAGCINTATVCLANSHGDLLGELRGHTDAVTSLHWSGDTLATASADGTVRLWTAEQDQTVSSDRYPPIHTPTALAVDHQRQLAAVGDDSGWIATLAADAEPQRLIVPDLVAPVTSLAFLADGRLAAVYQSHAVAVWTIGKPAPDKLVTLDNLSFSRVAALTGDIRAAVPLSDKTTLVLSGDDLREARVAADKAPLDQWGLTAAPAANTAFVSTSDGSIRRRDLGAATDGTLVYDAGTSLCGAAPTTDNNGAKSLDVSADGKWLAATRTDALIIVHNLVDPSKPLCLALPAADSKTVAFSPNSRRLAILSATDRLTIFDLAHPEAAEILAAPATPTPSTDKSRTTAWLAWQDDATVLVATTAGTLEAIALDPAGWRTRVDSLFFSQ